jgi:2-aminoadipate transaminase
MKGQFARRMGNIQRSFIREILKVAQDPNIISFAGGLPNPDYFPVEPLRLAADKVLAEKGINALQYAPTMGNDSLRQWIADRYRKTCGVDVPADDILITNGSQQGLELAAKILIDEGDHVILESPSYIGGIQAFSLFQPKFVTVPLLADGPDTAVLHHHATHDKAKLFYALPNFQNPTGITYSAAKREEVAAILNENNIFFIEDDPYRELRFIGESLPPLASYGREHAFLLGSFSKIVAPGFRMGWMVARPELMEKLIIAKQASDLHSNYVSQLILCQYLQDNDLDGHIATIREAYGRQRTLMVAMIEELFPPEVSYTLPEGGMFLWVTLPESMSAMALFEAAAKRNVVFVPGDPFHVDGSGKNTLRLNFSNTDEAKIETGMKRLAEVVREGIVSSEQ